MCAVPRPYVSEIRAPNSVSRATLLTVWMGVSSNTSANDPNAGCLTKITSTREPVKVSVSVSLLLPLL